MPWFSYHGGHSGQFCRHAKGSLAEVVEQALAAGFTHYGLSEHCPRYRDEDLFEEEEELGTEGLIALFDEYAQEARRLRDEFAGQLELLVGFETERLPPEDWVAAMTRLREAVQPDFVVGSVHHVDARCIDYSKDQTEALARELGGRVELERAYFDDLTDLVAELRPEVVGHLDLVRKFDGADAAISEDAWPNLLRTLEAAEAYGSVLDVNAGAHRRGLSPVYPLDPILERALRMGIGVTLGDDSHDAHDVGGGLDACVAAITRAGYQEVAYFARREGIVQKLSAPIAEVEPAGLG